MILLLIFGDNDYYYRCKIGFLFLPTEILIHRKAGLFIKEGKINAWKLYKTHNQEQKKQYPGFNYAAIIVSGHFKL
jgi:hypothetical protein